MFMFPWSNSQEMVSVNQKMKAIIGAAIENAPFREFLSMDYTYQQLQFGFLQQPKTMQVEDLK